ncbi:MAG: hypothetical protein KJ550_10420 [Proteobacteria bacterium]|nr:hypothetical protein [Pseudomonadota bacterium]MBU4068201.1 hypothetical protein [Pseudomonadota bacterium]
MSDVRCQRSDVRDQMSEIRCQRSDVRDQMSEIRCQMSEDGSLRSELCVQELDLSRNEVGFLIMEPSIAPTSLHSVVRRP